MTTWKRQEGSALLMVLGVVTAVAISASIMVAVTMNVRHNSARDRTETNAFNVAESGIDAQQALLQNSWPTTAALGTSVKLDPTVFRSSFSTAELPNPRTGQFIDVQVIDDNGDLANPGMDPNWPNGAWANYDKNNNKRVWIVSRGATSTGAGKVMVLVERQDTSLVVRGHVALFTEGSANIDGGGNGYVIGADNADTAVVIAVGGLVAKKLDEDLAPGVTQASDATTMNDILPDEMLVTLIQTAQAAGKVYNTQAAIPVAAWSSDPRIIVVNSGGVDTKDMPDTDGGSSTWTEDHPGVLIVLSGNLTAIGQKKLIYGLVYLMNGINLGGNAEIHGMMLSKCANPADNVWMHGGPAISYNDKVIQNLNRPVTLSVKQVPNTWRELTP